MNEKNNSINYKNEIYYIVNKRRYLGNTYLYVINCYDKNDIKILKCAEDLKEVDDIKIIRKLMLQI
ncbi:MAG: hypothetical protein IJ842_05425 [Bacilli bacterium]|nr:hypothetical protein [Bacilli bacterium]